MCLRGDVPFDPVGQNQILSAHEEWQKLGHVIDSWQMKKKNTQQSHATCRSSLDNRWGPWGRHASMTKSGIIIIIQEESVRWIALY